RKGAGQHLDDDAVLLLLARHVLAGPADDGRASYQIAMNVCEDCQRARQLADGELVEVSTEVANGSMRRAVEPRCPRGRTHGPNVRARTTSGTTCNAPVSAETRSSSLSGSWLRPRDVRRCSSRGNACRRGRS